MTTSILETTLFTKLQSFFEEHGFLLLAEKKQFRKTTNFGFRNIIFTVTDYDSEKWIEVNFGVRHNEVERLAQQFIGNSREFWEDANTLVISIGKFNNLKYFRYKVSTEEDLLDTCFEIKKFMSNQGFLFLRNTESINQINTILNAESLKPSRYLYNQIHRCFKGLIAARIAGHQDFMKLSDQYRNQVIKLGGSDDDVFAYERLLSFLLYWSVN
jgi:hypothetical protein